MNEQRPQFYLYGHEAWETMLRLCSNASESIDLEQYIFSDDEISKRFVEILRERAKAGVKVRLLCDTVGSWYFYTSNLPSLMQKDGVEIRFFHPVSPWRINNFFSWFFRDHRKILVVDNKTGFTGGIGIRDNMRDWRDTNVEVTGAIVSEMATAFAEMWDRAADRKMISRIQRARGFTRGFQFLTSAPYIHKRFLYYSIIDALRNAKRYIYITTPYFVPDRRLTRVLKLAARRGVEVKIVVPVECDEPFVGIASRSHYETILQAGVRIFEYQKTFLHAKTIVIDDEWSTVGSFNLDNLSFLYNNEANIVSTQSDFAESLKKHFAEDLMESKEVLFSDWQKRSSIERFSQFIILPIRRFL